MSLVALISPVVPEAAVPTPKLSNCTSLPVSNDKEALAVAPVSKTKLDYFRHARKAALPL